MRSALRSSPAAYVASWIDSLPALMAKDEALARQIVAKLEHDATGIFCLRALQEARASLIGGGVVGLPSWSDALRKTTPPTVADTDAGEFPKGWQCYTSSFLETLFMERVVLPSSCASRRALLLSQCWPGSGAWMTALPTHAAVRMSPLRMQVAIRRRLRWPLPLEVQRCNGQACRAKLDPFGDHWASCNRSGRLLRRSRPIERTWARVFLRSQSQSS